MQEIQLTISFFAPPSTPIPITTPTTPTINSPRHPTTHRTLLDPNLFACRLYLRTPRDPFLTPPNQYYPNTPLFTPIRDSPILPELGQLQLSTIPRQPLNPFYDHLNSVTHIDVQHRQYYERYYHLNTPRDVNQNIINYCTQPGYSTHTPCPPPSVLLSTEQTRRVTRRADENAAPAMTRLKSSSAVTAVPAAGKGSTTSSIPVLKRTHSSVTATAPPPAATKSTAGGTKRSALGEVTNGGKKDNLKGGKGKEEGGREKRALQQTSSAQIPSTLVTGPARRTRSSGASTDIPAVTVVEPAAKRRTTSRIPVASRSRSTTTSASNTATESSRLKERKLNIAIETKEVVEPEPARKKRKTSSPAFEEEQDEDDLADEGLYDEDGQEVVFNSGGRGTRLKSPERAVRAKDAGWTDLDAEDDGDPTMVSEYVVDAFNYMLSIESKSMPDPDYMDRQAELTWDMRALLMDWMIEVHAKFRLLPETLLIAVNMIDRFLSQRVVSLEKLQLVGMTALFISAKYEEVICPSITHFLHMADGGFEVDDMIKAERYMLSTLDFDMSYPNPLHFLRRISKADGYDIQTRTLAKFLIEVMCVHEELLKYKSSLLAAAGTWLARLCLDRGSWNPNLIHYSTYAVSELLEPAQIMVNYVVSPDLNTDGGFYKKYASKKHMKSSVYIRQWALNRWPESAKGTCPHQGNELVAEIEGKLEPVIEISL